MRLLITTQAVDENDLYLGFFTGWLREFSAHFERIEVICLKEGTHTLPKNVAVHSLGKEGGRSRFKYIARLLRYSWTLRNEYDAVFVHMNQEYVLVCGILWLCMGKRIYLWRNHQAGSVMTSIAASMCMKVFCTSKFSYTARYRKTVFMPVGIDTALYRSVESVARTPRSILFFARMAPSKRPDMLLEALGELAKNRVDFTASFYGTPLPQFEDFLASLRSRAETLGLSGRVTFFPGQPHAEGPRIFSAHDIFVNLAASGMYDKMIFEAAACGCLVLASSLDFRGIAEPRFSFEENGSDLPGKITALLGLSPTLRDDASRSLRALAEQNSLTSLALRLKEEL